MLPVIALTGFLGSGKTTLLQHWLKSAPVAPERCVLIINDFGPVNIDAALLAGLPYDLRSIAGGCVCCTSYGELIDELDALAEEDIDLVWLETSGLAEPEEVLDHLTDPQLRDRVHVQRLVQVIDAANYPGTWRHRSLEESQIRFADILVISKADLVDDTRLGELRTQLRTLNPHAEIVTAEQGKADVQTLWSAEASHAATTPTPVHHTNCCNKHPQETSTPAASVHFHPVSDVLTRTHLSDMLRVLPESVVRAKGIIRLTEAPDVLHAFQYVRGQGAPLIVALDTLPDPSPATGLVLIGPALDSASLEKLLQK